MSTRSALVLRADPTKQEAKRSLPHRWIIRLIIYFEFPKSLVNMRVCSIKFEKLLFIIKMIIYGLKIIGLAPLSVPTKVSAQTNSHNSNNQAFQYSRIGLAYNILFLIPMLIALVISFHLSDIFSPNDPRIIIRAVESSFFTLAACIVVISWGWKQKEGASIMNRLLEVDARLSILTQQPFNKRGLILITVHVIINISLWIISLVRRIIYFGLEALILEFFAKIPNCILHWFIIEYLIVVGLLVQYFQMVNEYLLNLNKFGNYLSRSRVGDGYLIPVMGVPGNHTSQLSSLRILYGVRMQLYELCGHIAEFFSLPILFCITCAFAPLVHELYHAIDLYHNINTNISRATNTIYIILTIFFYAYPIMSLAINVTRTGKELTQFSLQLLHEEIKFTAYGFITLEPTMLFSIFGGTASYFVGIMQLQSAYTCASSNNTTSD